MRVRPTVRLRLTALYGGLFLVMGALLLAVNYGLVRSRLGPSHVKITRSVEAPTVDSGVTRPPAGDVIGDRATLDPLDPDEAEEVQALLDDASEEIRNETLDELLAQSALALAASSIASVALGWIVAGRVLRPVHHMTSTARRLSEEDLHERIGLTGPDDELKELGDTFDAMLERLDDAFSRERRFVANASHELRTPLAIQRTLVEVALADPARGHSELSAIAEELRTAFDRSDELIESLLMLARSQRRVEVWQDLDLATAAHRAIDVTRSQAVARGLTVHTRTSPATTHGDAILLERMVANLVDNAIAHNVDGGHAWITTSPAGGGKVRILVANTGALVDPDDVAGLFEPFRRGTSDRLRADAGAGLGLSIVRAVVDAHDGHIRAHPRPQGGLEIEALLPSVATAAAR